MAEQIISPGVFTRENDLTFLPQGIGQIGAAIVGPTDKGPAFVPTVVNSFSEFERRFGGLSPETFVPQTVREYLRNAGAVTVCRVLAGGGSTYPVTGTVQRMFAIAANQTKSTCKIGCDDGDENITSDEEGSFFTITDGNGTAKEFLIVDTNNQTSNSTAGDILSTGDDTGASTLASARNGAIAVPADITGGDPTNAADVLTQLANAINHANGFGGTDGKGTITASAVSGTGHGEQTITLTSNIGGVVPPAVTDSNADGEFKVNGAGDSEAWSDVSTAVNARYVLMGLVLPSKSTGAPDLGTTAMPISIAATASFGLELNGAQGITAHTGDKTISCSLDVTRKDYIEKKLGKNPYNSKTGVVSFTGVPGYLHASFKNLHTQMSTPLTTTSLSSSFQVNDYANPEHFSSFGYTGLNAASEVTCSMQTAEIKFTGGPLMAQEEKYSMASTPFITSQFVDDDKNVKDLFRFHTIAHGTSCNTDYKISITGLKEPGDIDGEEQYSKFTVSVRKYNDKDDSAKIIEEYKGVDLDPHSVNFISRRIGDRYPQYNDTLDKVELLGNYPNVSNIIRVEVADGISDKNFSPKYSPKGFQPLYNLVDTASFDVNIGNIAFPSCSYEAQQVVGSNYSVRGHLGWKFNEKATDNENWLKPIADGAKQNVAGKFNVEDCFGHASSSLWSGSLSASIDETGTNGPTSTQLKFSIPFQGGFDGIPTYTPKFTGAESTLDEVKYTGGSNLYGFDLSGTNKAGYKGYKKALDILSNQDEYDINMLALPGVLKQLHSSVTDKATTVVEERGDCFYVMDLGRSDLSVNDAVSQVSGLDTNYAAVYYPWVKVLDSSVNRPILVPPSVIVPGAIAASDNIAAEWFAPAGLNRGILGNVLEAKIRLNQAERDKLYDNKINPIATFPQTGVCIWGQKTLQERPTALDRINVRRLLIALKKFIASSSRYLVFEQNTLDTRARFLQIVNPYLESVQSRQGLYSFRVVMDESNNTPDVIDRNQLVGAIYLQPTRTAEFIVLDFNVMPTGASFDGGGGSGY
jgi:hypothetical protein